MIKITLTNKQLSKLKYFLKNSRIDAKDIGIYSEIVNILEYPENEKGREAYNKKNNRKINKKEQYREARKDKDLEFEQERVKEVKRMENEIKNLKELVSSNNKRIGTEVNNKKELVETTGDFFDPDEKSNEYIKDRNYYG